MDGVDQLFNSSYHPYRTRPAHHRRLQLTLSQRTSLSISTLSTNSSSNNSSNNNNSNSNNNSDDEDESQPVRKRAKRHSKNRSDGALPTQLQFYPSLWADILEESKQRYRLYLATENAFPHPKKDRHRATECLMEAIAAHEEDGGKVEQGKSVFLNAMRLIYLQYYRIHGRLRARHDYLGMWHLCSSLFTLTVIFRYTKKARLFVAA